MRNGMIVVPPLAGLVLLGIILSGCSSAPPPQGPLIPAQRPLSQTIKNDKSLLDAYDPLERFNRGMYNFNARFDDYVFLPVVRAYETVTPNGVEDRISSFFSNVSDLRNLWNSVLQLKPQQSVETLARLVFNTTVGVLGLWDPATAMGLPQRREDFGQTLGYYGLGPGPYLVLPLLGPSNLRDSAGLIVDTLAFNALDPLRLGEHPERAIAYTTLDAIDTRHSVDFRYYESGSPFEYDQVRLLYSRLREAQIEKSQAQK